MKVEFIKAQLDELNNFKNKLARAHLVKRFEYVALVLWPVFIFAQTNLNVLHWLYSYLGDAIILILLQVNHYHKTQYLYDIKRCEINIATERRTSWRDTRLKLNGNLYDKAMRDEKAKLHDKITKLVILTGILLVGVSPVVFGWCFIGPMTMSDVQTICIVVLLFTLGVTILGFSKVYQLRLTKKQPKVVKPAQVVRSKNKQDNVIDKILLFTKELFG